MKLLKCNTCGKIYKITKEINRIDNTNSELPKYEHYFVTDMGGKIGVHYNNIKCLNCGEYTPYEIMEIEDWVADLAFKVRGS